MMLLRPPRMPCEMVGARTVMPRTTPLYSRTLRPCTSNVVETIMVCALAMDSPWFWVDASVPDRETERLAGEFPPQRREGIVVRVHHPLLERDDGVVRDRDRLGTDLGTTLRDVAVPDPSCLAEIRPGRGSTRCTCRIPGAARPRTDTSARYHPARRRRGAGTRGSAC